MDQCGGTNTRSQPVASKGPLQYEPAWRPQRRMTMSGDMPLPLLDMVNQVLGAEMRAERDEECLNLEVSNSDVWKQTCTLWRQTGWISKRVALAANHRAEEERAARYAPQMSQTAHYDTRTGKLPLVKQRNLSKMVKWSFSVS